MVRIGEHRPRVTEVGGLSRRHAQGGGSLGRRTVVQDPLAIMGPVPGTEQALRHRVLFLSHQRSPGQPEVERLDTSQDPVGDARPVARHTRHEVLPRLSQEIGPTILERVRPELHLLLPWASGRVHQARPIRCHIEAGDREVGGRHRLRLADDLPGRGVEWLPPEAIGLSLRDERQAVAVGERPRSSPSMPGPVVNRCGPPVCRPVCGSRSNFQRFLMPLDMPATYRASPAGETLKSWVSDISVSRMFRVTSSATSVSTGSPPDSGTIQSPLCPPVCAAIHKR